MEKGLRQEYDEHGTIQKILEFRLPHKFKKIGLISAGLVFLFILVYPFVGANDILIKDLCRSIVLFMMLIASLSKDVIEDEYVTHVRSQSYVIAFVCSTVYTVCIPLVALLLDLLITKVSGDGVAQFYEISAFEIIFMLLGFQLLSFEVLKRFGRA